MDKQLKGLFCWFMDQHVEVYREVNIIKIIKSRLKMANKSRKGDENAS